jgi:pimeloyl-ACP methyl ester carboxylesterase
MQLKTKFRALDGLRLAGTLTLPDEHAAPAVLLLHGNGVTREESGLFTRLAAALGQAGVPSLRFDLRAHGESEGRQEDRTLTAHLNDIQAGLAHLREATGATATSLVATSFSGGLAAWYAASRPAEVTRLVLLNPQLDHKSRFIDEKPWWVDGVLDEEHARQLSERGHLDHSPSVRTGRALLNEVFWIRARTVLGGITTPTLLLHGVEDSLIPVESSRSAVRQIGGSELIEFEGADHGFTVPGDDRFLEPRTLEWQGDAIGHVVAWITSGSTDPATTGRVL